jgi:hypothetical protein
LRSPVSVLPSVRIHFSIPISARNRQIQQLKRLELSTAPKLA